MSEGFRTVEIEIVDERKGRFWLEQLEEDPEYFHVWDGDEIVEIFSNEADARDCFDGLVAEEAEELDA